MEASLDQGSHVLSEPGRPAPPCAVVIFGAAGDLTKRKLVPALYNLKALGLLPREFAIVGVARREKTHEQFREEQTRDIAEFATTRVDGALWAELREAMYYQAGELSDPAVYTQLADLLAQVAKRHGTGGNTLFYLAIPPSLFGEVVRRLGEAGLVRERGGFLAARHRREAVRPRPRVRPDAQRRAGRGAARGPDLPDRPLPREGDGPEHPGLPLREQPARADLEPDATSTMSS